MRLEDYLDVQAPDVIRLRGHRIGLEHIVEAHNEGETPEQIVAHYPTLSLEQVYAVIAYYLHYRAEVEAYLARVNAVMETQQRAYQPSEVMRRVRMEVDARRQRDPGGDGPQISPR